MNLIEIGQKFAEFRNQNNFASASLLLHPRCVHIYKNKATIGREHILKTFKAGPQLAASADTIENGVRIRSETRDELLIIEDGLIVKIEVSATAR